MYRQTFRNHRTLLIAPIVVVMFLALWITAGAPKRYEATASLWVDNLPPAPSSLTQNDPAIRTPADQEQTLVTELLQTRDFRVRVAHEGPLAAYLGSHPSNGWGPTALLSQLRGAPSVDMQITKEFGPKEFTTFEAGPQVLQLSYKAGTPQVAAGTLKALLLEIGRSQSRFNAERDKATVSYNQSQVTAATKALSDARQNVLEYQRAHPAATSSDPQLAALERTARTASKDLAAKTTTLNQSQLAPTTLSPQGTPSASTGFSVIDPPKIPTGPVSGKKKLVMAVVGGLFAGGILSLLGLIMLTPSRPAEPHLRAVGGSQVGAQSLHAAPTPAPKLHPVTPEPPPVERVQPRTWSS
jgi:uncharacterized protein involved in exopolysaccharide biosynthesis